MTPKQQNQLIEDIRLKDLKILDLSSKVLVLERRLGQLREQPLTWSDSFDRCAEALQSKP